MAFLDWMPVVGDFVDDLFNPVASIFGIDDTSRLNRSNERIAAENIKMQRETNEINRQNVLDTNKSNEEIARQYNANQVQLQSDMNVFNKEMWDLNNEYNSPAEQLVRAERAGINPNIVFGQPVASSPVQQTSIPSQQMVRMEPYQQRAPHNDMKYVSSRILEKLGDALRGLSRLPIVSEHIKQLKAKTREDQANASLAEEEARKSKERRHAWEHMSVIRSLDGRYAASPSEFESMDDEEKKLFVKPYAFRDRRFTDRLVNNLDEISKEQRKFYEPLYDFGNAKFEKLGLHSVEEYEDYKKRQSYGNTLLEIRADSVRNRLRMAVDEGKVKDRGVVHALIHMDGERYLQLTELYKRLKRENQWSVEDRPLELEMLGLTKSSIERQASHDFFTYIDKIGKGDMSSTDYVKMLLVGLHDILTGGSSIAPYLFSKKK